MGHFLSFLVPSVKEGSDTPLCRPEVGVPWPGRALRRSALRASRPPLAGGADRRSAFQAVPATMQV